MRIYIDCEWNSYQGALISMALVAANGDYWYRSLGCANPDPWVAANVMPIIDMAPITLQEFQEELQEFLSSFPDVEIVADWPEDLAHFCRVLITGPGQRLQYPPLRMRVIPIDTVSERPHNALADAWALRNTVEAVLA